MPRRSSKPKNTVLKKKRNPLNNDFTIPQQEAYEDFMDASERLILSQFANRGLIFFDNRPVNY